MPGMNTLGSSGISDYQSRTVTIEVTGVCQQSVLKKGFYKIKVPYSQMTQTMQTINRQGGKVASIQLMGNEPVFSGVKAPQPAPQAESSAPAAAPSPEKQANESNASKRKRR
jgi:phycocyanin-associated, rod